MSRMTRILINIIISFILFFVLLICALFVSIIPTFYLDSIILEIICFFAILIPLSFSIIVVVDYLGKKVIRRYRANLRIKKIKILLTPSVNFDLFQSCDDISVYFVNKHHLKTTSPLVKKLKPFIRHDVIKGLPTAYSIATRIILIISLPLPL